MVYIYYAYANKDLIFTLNITLRDQYTLKVIF